MLSVLHTECSRDLCIPMRFTGRVREQLPAKTGHAHYQPCGNFRSKGESVSTQPSRHANYQYVMSSKFPRVLNARASPHTCLIELKKNLSYPQHDLSHVCVSRTAYLTKRPNYVYFISENADGALPTPVCPPPLVTKLLGELPVPKRIHGSFKRVVDRDGLSDQGSMLLFPSDGRPIALGRDGNQEKKMRRGR